MKKTMKGEHMMEKAKMMKEMPKEKSMKKTSKKK